MLLHHNGLWIYQRRQINLIPFDPLLRRLDRNHKRPIPLPLRLNNIHTLQRSKNILRPKPRQLLQSLQSKRMTLILETRPRENTRQFPRPERDVPRVTQI